MCRSQKCNFDSGKGGWIRCGIWSPLLLWGQDGCLSHVVEMIFLHPNRYDFGQYFQLGLRPWASPSVGGVVGKGGGGSPN